MSKEKEIPVETIVGTIHYRDAIHMDQQSGIGYEVSFKGELNGKHVTCNPDNKEWIPFELVFTGVIAFFSCELDMYEGLVTGNSTGSFNTIENSEFLQKLHLNTEPYTHYRLYTYDYVYDIAARKYELSIN